MWFTIAITVALLVVFMWWMRRPLYHRNVKPEEFERYVRGFVNQCTDGSLIFVEHEGSPRFVQFAKRRSNGSRTVLQFGFPDVEWSRGYFDTMVNTFQALEFRYIITKGEGPVRRFLELNLVVDDPEDSVIAASRVARVAFKAMGLDEGATFRVHVKGNLSLVAARPSLEVLSNRSNGVVRKLSQRCLNRLGRKEGSNKNMEQ
jgi:hypothetical protein